MKKSIIKQTILLGGIIMSIFLLSGCFHKKIEKVNIENTKSFSFGYSVGNYMNGNVIYEIEKKDGKIIASYKANEVPDEDKLEKEISEETLKELEEILKKHKVYEWNGFKKSDPNVLDGNSFHLYYWTENKENIDASGYMMYPNGYGEFKAEIHEFFTTLFKEEIEKQKTTNE